MLYAEQMLVNNLSKKENTQNAETPKHVLNLSALVASLIVSTSLLFCSFAL